MKTEKFLSLLDIVQLVGIVPIAGYSLPIEDIMSLRFKRITYTQLKYLFETQKIKNQ
jgi:hypothetical protein